MTARPRPLAAAGDVGTRPPGIPSDARYRPAQGQEERCATCSYFAAGTNFHCGMWDVPVDPDFTCDEWALGIPAAAFVPVRAGGALDAADHPPPGLDHHNRTLIAAYKRVDDLEPKLAAILEPILRDAGVEAARAFERLATNHLTAAGNPDWSAPAPDEIIDIETLAKELRAKTEPTRLAVIQGVMDPTLEAAGLSFDVTNPLTKEVLAQSGSQVTNIAETTQLNVMRAIRHGYEQGLSIPNTAKAIQAGMAAASPARATLIARTELAGAANGGSLAATRIVADATGTQYQKQWLTAPGARFPRHEDYPDLDGQTVALDATFTVGEDQLMFPGDPGGSPEEVCNCRCAMVYVEPSGQTVDGGSADTGIAEAPVEGEGDEEMSAEPPTVFDGGTVDTTPAGYDIVDRGSLEGGVDARGNADDFFGEHYAPLEHEIDAAKWPDGPAQGEAYEAATRVGIDTVSVLRDDAGKMLGISDYDAGLTESDVRAAQTAVESLQRVLPTLDEFDAEHAQATMDGLRSLIERERTRTEIGVNHLASTGTTPGVGARLMRDIAQTAADRGLGVGLNSLPEAEGFYQRLGMIRDPLNPSDFHWTPEQAAEYARGEWPLTRAAPPRDLSRSSGAAVPSGQMVPEGDNISVATGTPVPMSYVQFINDHGLVGYAQPSELSLKILDGFKDTESKYYNKATGEWSEERRKFHDEIVARYFANRERTVGRPVAYFTSGGGASGKSYAPFRIGRGRTGPEVASRKLAESTPDVIHIDPDELKKEFPEYKALWDANDPFAASAVHEESSWLAKRITQEAIDRRQSYLLDTTGSGNKAGSSFADKIAQAKAQGYETKVSMFSIETNEAVVRSIDRGDREGRYVSIGALKEAHSGASRQLGIWSESPGVDAWQLFDNTLLGEPILVAEGGGGAPVTIYRPDLWVKTLKKAQESPGAAPAAVVVPPAATASGSVVDVPDPKLRKRYVLDVDTTDDFLDKPLLRYAPDGNPGATGKELDDLIRDVERRIAKGETTVLPRNRTK